MLHLDIFIIVFRAGQHRCQIWVSSIEADWEGSMLDQHWWLVCCLTLPSYPHLIIRSRLISNRARLLSAADQLHLLWCGLPVPPCAVSFLDDHQLTFQFRLLGEPFLLVGIGRGIT